MQAVELPSTRPTTMGLRSTPLVEDGESCLYKKWSSAVHIAICRYAMERISTQISVWFWPRNDASVPAEVKNGASVVTPANWGTPFAKFVNNNCDINSKFGPNNIIINLTLCKFHRSQRLITPLTCYNRWWLGWCCLPRILPTVLRQWVHGFIFWMHARLMFFFNRPCKQ